jgi:sec-independent protein translocase protein TatC
VILFYCGMAFAYYVVFPLVFGFFSSVGPEIVSISTDIGRYLDFVLALFFGFGIAFEVPIATIILVAMGLTTPKKLAQKRPFVIVGAFITGMLLTPPDVISQVLLAVPMWLLFEVGVIASARIFADRLARDEQEEAEQQAEQAAAGVAGASYVDGYDVVDDPAQSAVDSDYQPLSDEEMEAELDDLDDDEDDTDYDDPLADGYSGEDPYDQDSDEEDPDKPDPAPRT